MASQTPFHSRTAPLNKQHNWRQWSGYLAAGVYDDFVQPEYNAIRNKAALIDVSPLYKHRVLGPDATALVQRVFTRDMHKCDVLQAVYTPWCDADGQVMQEGTVFRHAEDDSQVYAAEPLMRWLLLNSAGLDVEVMDYSESVAALALQGPTSRDVLASCFDGDVRELKFFRMARGSIEGVSTTISRTGYTGDLGYELWMPADRGLEVWDAIMRAGKPWGVTPCGILAMDVARVEAGFVLLDVDYIGAEHALIPEHAMSPYELGMGWAVKLDKGAFIGRDVLAARRDRGVSRRVVGLQVDWEPLEQIYGRVDLMPDLPLIACREPVPVYGEGRYAGRATTRCWSTLLKKYVAIATVEARYADPGTMVEMEVTVNFRRQRVAARISDLAHFRPDRLRA